MSDGFRRLILPPATVDAERTARLADALQDAVHAQNRLAANSPYILRFVGPLEEQDGVLSVAHEPATPLNAADLFDPSKPLMEPAELVRLLVALADALAAAHGGGGARTVVHGGLCPGVLLMGVDGLPRVTDFGFAPAVCKTLGVDPYLNLAVRPHATGTGAWEVLPLSVVDRDDRLCAYIDPDKYGSETLASFETGSDIVAAGMVAALFAEHVHPYLYFEPEAHRVVDMARMMGFGIPAAPSRDALTQSSDSSVRAWLELVTAMLARLPGDRPSAAAISQRLLAVAPAVDLNNVKVQRWLAQVEQLLAGRVWAELDAVLDLRPPLEIMTAEQRAQAHTLETRAREGLAEEGRKAAAEAELQAVAKWFGRLQNAVSAGEWEKAQNLLSEKPQVDAWPPDVLAALEPLAAKIAQSQGLRKAQSWLKILQKTAAARNWSGVAKLLGQKPPLESWPEDLQASVTAVEQEYAAHQEQQDRLRREMADQHAAARAWVAKAKELIEQTRWDAALDVLDQEPQLQHWPAGLKDEAAALVLICRTRLVDDAATNIAALTESMRVAADSVLQPLAEGELAGLVQSKAIETAVEFITWAPPDIDADARARVRVALRPAGERFDAPPLIGELDFRVREDGVQLCGEQETFATQIGIGLLEQLPDLQKSRLGTFEKWLQGTMFPRATVRAEMAKPGPRVTAELALLGPDAAEGRGPLELVWLPESLTWEPADRRAFVAQATDVAKQAAGAAIVQDLVARSELARTYKDVLRVRLTPVHTEPELPTTLDGDVAIALHPAGGEPEVIFATTVTVEDAGRATLESLAEFETHLRERIVELQSHWREAAGEQIKAVAKAAPSAAKVTVPRQGKVALAEIGFDIKPKSGEAFVLRAVWSPAKLVYELPAGWEQKFGAAAGSAPAVSAAAPPPVAPPPPKPVRAPKPAAATPEERPTEKAAAAKPRPAGSRRGFVIGGGVAAVAAVAAILFFALRGGTPPPQPAPPVNPPVATTADSAPPTATAPTPPEPVAVQEPDKPEPPPEPPPVKTVDWTQQFAAYIGAAPERFGAKADNANLLRELSPSGDPLAAQASTVVANLMVPGSAMYANVRSAGDERVTFSLRVNLRSGAESVAQDLTMEHSGERWGPSPDNATALAKLADAARASLKTVVQVLRGDVDKTLRGEAVADWRPRLAEVTPLLTNLPDDADATALLKSATLLPPPWDEQQAALATRGYAAESDRDPVSGYPTNLRDGQGNRLRLVSIPPQDGLWKSVADQAAPPATLAHLTETAAAPERPWTLYYVDEKEVSVSGAFAEATAAATQLGRVVPTVDEWVLAALRWGANAPADLFGGLREWCTGAGTDATLACGGVTRKIREQETILPPPPKKPLNSSEMWKWLSNPLVLQARDARFGDELTGVRPVLRVLPR